MSQVLWAAAVLACPIGMGAMMWMMMRGNHGAATADESEIARLRAEVNQLKSEREREIRCTPASTTTPPQLEAQGPARVRVPPHDEATTPTTGQVAAAIAELGYRVHILD